MATFTRTWNPSYEALPPDTENAKNGAERINEAKVDIRERMEIDHSMAGDSDDGTHKKITFVDPLASAPTAAVNQGFLYTKDSGGKAELFYEDEDGKESQITNDGCIFPVGFIYQSTDSTNPATLFGGTWTSLQGMFLFAEDGTAGYSIGDTGGSKDAVNVSHTHSDTFSILSGGNHTHTVGWTPFGGSSSNITGSAGGAGAVTNATISSSSGSHGHTISGSINSSGVSGTGKNMPPFKSVYMWERTA